MFRRAAKPFQTLLRIMPTNLKRFTKELKEKNALIRKIAQANAV